MKSSASESSLRHLTVNEFICFPHATGSETLFMYYIARCLYFSSTVALSMHCFGCHSSSSWADCEKKLQMYNCGEGDWVCFTQVLNITGRGLSYRKGCGERHFCDPDTCHTQRTTCEIHCCCEDYCNAGIPGQGVNVSSSKASILSISASYITVVLVLQIFTL